MERRRVLIEIGHERLDEAPASRRVSFLLVERGSRAQTHRLPVAHGQVIDQASGQIFVEWAIRVADARRHGDSGPENQHAFSTSDLGEQTGKLAPESAALPFRRLCHAQTHQVNSWRENAAQTRNRWLTTGTATPIRRAIRRREDARAHSLARLPQLDRVAARQDGRPWSPSAGLERQGRFPPELGVASGLRRPPSALVALYRAPPTQENGVFRALGVDFRGMPLLPHRDPVTTKPRPHQGHSPANAGCPCLRKRARKQLKENQWLQQRLRN
jgi:hypothetical protein